MTNTEEEIDWGYEWRVIRWRRLNVSRGNKAGFRLGVSWCYSCQRMTLSFWIGRIYGTINCRDVRTLKPPPQEWPDWIGSDDEFFDEFTIIE